MNELERMQANCEKRHEERVFHKFDAGAGFRSKDEDGDCQIRALMTTRGMTFDAAYDLLYALHPFNGRLRWSNVRYRWPEFVKSLKEFFLGS